MNQKLIQKILLLTLATLCFYTVHVLSVDCVDGGGKATATANSDIFACLGKGFVFTAGSSNSYTGTCAVPAADDSAGDCKSMKFAASSKTGACTDAAVDDPHCLGTVTCDSTTLYLITSADFKKISTAMKVNLCVSQDNCLLYGGKTGGSGSALTCVPPEAINCYVQGKKFVAANAGNSNAHAYCGAYSGTYGIEANADLCQQATEGYGYDSALKKCVSASPELCLAGGFGYVGSKCVAGNKKNCLLSGFGVNSNDKCISATTAALDMKPSLEECTVLNLKFTTDKCAVYTSTECNPYFTEFSVDVCEPITGKESYWCAQFGLIKDTTKKCKRPSTSDCPKQWSYDPGTQLCKATPLACQFLGLKKESTKTVCSIPSGSGQTTVTDCPIASAIYYNRQSAQDSNSQTIYGGRCIPQIDESCYDLGYRLVSETCAEITVDTTQCPITSSTYFTADTTTNGQCFPVKQEACLYLGGKWQDNKTPCKFPYDDSSCKNIHLNLKWSATEKQCILKDQTLGQATCVAMGQKYASGTMCTTQSDDGTYFSLDSSMGFPRTELACKQYVLKFIATNSFCQVISSKTDCTTAGLIWQEQNDQATVIRTSTSCSGTDTSYCKLPGADDCASTQLYDLDANIAPTAYKCIAKELCTKQYYGKICTIACENLKAPVAGYLYNMNDVTGKIAPFLCQACGVQNCQSCSTINAANKAIQCSTCKPGFYLSKTVSTTGSAETHQCIPCLGNCDICSDSKTCSGCKSGFALNQKNTAQHSCDACTMSLCDKCEIDTLGECTKCNNYAYLDDTTTKIKSCDCLDHKSVDTEIRFIVNATDYYKAFTDSDMSILYWKVKCVLATANTTGCILPIIDETKDKEIFDNVMMRIKALLDDTTQTVFTGDLAYKQVSSYLSSVIANTKINLQTVFSIITHDKFIASPTNYVGLINTILLKRTADNKNFIEFNDNLAAALISLKKFILTSKTDFQRDATLKFSVEAKYLSAAIQPTGTLIGLESTNTVFTGIFPSANTTTTTATGSTIELVILRSFLNGYTKSNITLSKEFQYSFSKKTTTTVNDTNGTPIPSSTIAPLEIKSDTVYYKFTLPVEEDLSGKKSLYVSQYINGKWDVKNIKQDKTQKDVKNFVASVKSLSEPLAVITTSYSSTNAFKLLTLTFGFLAYLILLF